MTKLLVVFGATGQQGGSVIKNVQKDAQLNKEWRIRAVTRDVTSQKAKELVNNGVEVVATNLNDKDSLANTFNGADATFIMTLPGAMNELKDGKAMADAAVEAGVEQIIFSTLPSVKGATNGKYNNISVFEDKKAVEDYIRALPVYSTFLFPTGFMSNYHNNPIYQYEKVDNDTLELISPSPSGCVRSLIDIDQDFGKYVCKVMKDAEKFHHKLLTLGNDTKSYNEIVSLLSRYTNKNIKYRQVSYDEFAKRFDESTGKLLINMFKYLEETPAPSEKELDEANEGITGLSTFESYLKQNNITID